MLKVADIGVGDLITWTGRQTDTTYKGVLVRIDRKTDNVQLLHLVGIGLGVQEIRKLRVWSDRPDLVLLAKMRKSA